MRDLPDTDIYSEMNKDPTQTQETKFTKVLKGLGKKGELPATLYNKIKTTGAKPHRIYGLPKMHKKEIFVRPIVACIDSPFYNLSKHIACLIALLAGHSPSFVKDCSGLNEFITSNIIDDNDVMVGSLFMNVSVEESVKIICDQLKSDDTLDDRMTLTPKQLLNY